MKTKTLILDIQKLKKFSDEKRHQETVWSDNLSRINLICMKPGQEITTHTHHGSHIWIVMEGAGEFLSAGEKQVIETGKVVIVPPLVDHGIRNSAKENLVIASIAAQGD
ncbi:MAG: cupin domain-containing protein [Nitrospiraceae bacterium]|nr:cupin domain-containing protein [Nitrospiraceae bacterium]